MLSLCPFNQTQKCHLPETFPVGENVTPPSKQVRFASGSLNHIDTKEAQPTEKRGGLFPETTQQSQPKRNRREEISKRLAEDSAMAQELSNIEFQSKQKELRAQEQDETIKRAVQAEIHRAHTAAGQNGSNLQRQLQIAQNELQVAQIEIKTMRNERGNKDTKSQPPAPLQADALTLILNAIENGRQTPEVPQTTQGHGKGPQEDSNPRRRAPGQYRQTEECRNFKRGRCNFPGCRFLHIDGPTGGRHNAGGNRGQNGNNKGPHHQGRQGDTRPKSTCFNYMDGECRFGVHCRFAHDTPEADRHKGRGAILKAEKFGNTSQRPQKSPAGGAPAPGGVNG
jgi:hypothetical protein